MGSHSTGGVRLCARENMELMFSKNCALTIRSGQWGLWNESGSEGRLFLPLQSVRNCSWKLGNHGFKQLFFLLPVCRSHQVKMCCAAAETSAWKVGLLAFCLWAGACCGYDLWEPVWIGSLPVKRLLSHPHSCDNDAGADLHSGMGVRWISRSMNKAEWVYGVC